MFQRGFDVIPLLSPCFSSQAGEGNEAAQDQLMGLHTKLVAYARAVLQPKVQSVCTELADRCAAFVEAFDSKRDDVARLSKATLEKQIDIANNVAQHLEAALAVDEGLKGVRNVLLLC